MRKAQDQPLSDVINQLIDQYKLRPKLNEVAIISCWEKTMGKAVTKQTQKIYLKNKILFVQFESAILKQELRYTKETIITKLNQAIGNEAIEDLIFL